MGKQTILFRSFPLITMFLEDSPQIYAKPAAKGNPRSSSEPFEISIYNYFQGCDKKAGMGFSASFVSFSFFSVLFFPPYKSVQIAGWVLVVAQFTEKRDGVASDIISRI